MVATCGLFVMIMIILTMSILIFCLDKTGGPTMSFLIPSHEGILLNS